MKTRGFEIISMYRAVGIHLPERKTGASTGYDFAAAEEVVIPPGDGALIPTGVKAYMQPDEVLLIYIRSSAALKKHLMLMNSVGVIDADYYGNLHPSLQLRERTCPHCGGGAHRAGDLHALSHGGRRYGGQRSCARRGIRIDGFLT